jgi:hypothetical protein
MQLVDQRDGTLTVHIVPRKPITHHELSRLDQYFEPLLSQLTLVVSDELPSRASGKRPLLIRE